MTELIGYLGRDREIKTTRTGNREYIVLDLAVSSWTDGRQSTTWHRCIVWNSDDFGHIGARIAKKGDKYRITGEPTSYTYTKDGEERTFSYFKANEAQIMQRTHAPEIP